MKANKAPSQRQLRMGEEVRHALAAALQKGALRDPLLEQAVISVSEVRMSPDLKHALCFVMPLDSTDPSAPPKAELVAALGRHAKYLRGQLAQRLRNLRYMPELRFHLDTSFDNFAKIDALLRAPEVARDLQKPDDEDGKA